MSCDSTKPLIIPAGSDSFSQIGENSTTLWPTEVVHLNQMKLSLLYFERHNIHLEPLSTLTLVGSAHRLLI